MCSDHFSNLHIALLRYAVFGLGSRAYPNFCAFAHLLDTLFHELGAEQILQMQEGDELLGQEQSFITWSQQVFKVSFIFIQDFLLTKWLMHLLNSLIALC